MELIKTVKIDDLGRIVLPRAFRDKYRWHTYSNVTLYDVGGKILIKPVKKESQDAINAPSGTEAQEPCVKRDFKVSTTERGERPQLH